MQLYGHPFQFPDTSKNAYILFNDVVSSPEPVVVLLWSAQCDIPQNPYLEPLDDDVVSSPEPVVVLLWSAQCDIPQNPYLKPLDDPLLNASLVCAGGGLEAASSCKCCLQV